MSESVVSERDDITMHIEAASIGNINRTERKHGMIARELIRVGPSRHRVAHRHAHCSAIFNAYEQNASLIRQFQPFSQERHDTSA